MICVCRWDCLYLPKYLLVSGAARADCGQGGSDEGPYGCVQRERGDGPGRAVARKKLIFPEGCDLSEIGTSDWESPCPSGVSSTSACRPRSPCMDA